MPEADREPWTSRLKRMASFAAATGKAGKDTTQVEVSACPHAARSAGPGVSCAAASVLAVRSLSASPVPPPPAKNSSTAWSSWKPVAYSAAAHSWRASGQTNCPCAADHSLIGPCQLQSSTVMSVAQLIRRVAQSGLAVGMPGDTSLLRCSLSPPQTTPAAHHGSQLQPSSLPPRSVRPSVPQR